MAAARTRDATGRPLKARSDAYVGLLLLALVAQVAGAVFLYLDWDSYPKTVPPKVATVPASTTPAQPQQPPGGGQQQGNPMPMPMPMPMPPMQ
jgi:hypothetical protein